MSNRDDETPLWTPSVEMVESARMTDFMRWAGARHRRSSPTTASCGSGRCRRSSSSGRDIWEYCGVRASAPYDGARRSRRRSLSAARMPGARWFEGAQLNYAENMLSAITILERRRFCMPRSCARSRELSWGQLSEQVAALAAGLRSLGVGRGDRVAAYMPNIPETLVAFLASASIGAIWSCAAPEFGARSVVDRFAQIEPKVLFMVDGYRHGGKDFDRAEALQTILGSCPRWSIGDASLPVGRRGRRRACPGGSSGRSLLATWAPGAEPSFEQVPFEHPLWVLYSSGTTGLPKAIVHGHGGISGGADEEEPSAPRPAPRRSHVLVHHDRLDDVELPGGLSVRDAAIVLYRRQPGPS